MKYIFIAVFLFCISNLAQADMVLDNFSSAKQHGSEVFSQSRTWYSFGGITIHNENKKLKAVGNSDTWAGFGIDPGAHGNNGAPISTGESKKILVNIKGTAPGVKLELYDDQYFKYEIWIDLANIPESGYEADIPPALLGKNIAKVQFVFAPGKVEIELNSISLK